MRFNHNQNVERLHQILKREMTSTRDRLASNYWPEHHNYIAQSYLQDVNFKSFDYQRRFYKHLKSAENFVFLERLRGRQADLYDNQEKKLI